MQRGFWMLHHEVESLVREDVGSSNTSLKPLHLQHQALLEGIRHLLPLFKQEASGWIGIPQHLQAILAGRTSYTGVPERLFDHSFLCLPERRASRVVDEAVFTFLLCSVFCEALRQSYNLHLNREALASCIPEIGAYTWFVPSHGLQTRLNSLLISCGLSPIPIYLAGEVYEGALTREEKKTLGQYYTPLGIADHLLDQAGYVPGEDISKGSL